ncbi:MAG: aminotransferase class I/II-fold pyridoxal phosphate-dependent enzyme [Bacillota bacterium]|nr:aminotransferase class I/II-fold pyridoxal phosphate-dependent enzyme [Bacillota bacterium]
MNTRVESVQISGIRKFYNKVLEVPGAISLTIGEPDVPVPVEVKEAMIEAINNDNTTYTPNMGLKDLRVELQDYLSRIGINYGWEEICITVGGSEGLFSVFNALLNSGDKVVVPSPAYPAYESVIKIVGGQVLDCRLKEDFTLDIEELERIIRENKPKMLVLSYPSNPTGAILGKGDREALYRLAEDNEIIIVTDEMYSSLVFDEYYSIAQKPELKDKVIVIGGFSKMFSMTGLRIGFVCAVDKFMKQILKVHQYAVSCAPSISQYGAIGGLRHCEKHVESFKQSLIQRRDYVYGRLVKMGFNVVLPKGAFYIFPSLAKFGMNSEIFCERLLSEAKVAAVPGTAFGPNGENHMRISYCVSRKNLEEAMDRMEGWVSKL